MITIASISDQHFWQKSRWQETLKIASWTLEQLALQKPDVIVLGGDLFEKEPTIAEMNAAGEWLDAARRICPVFGVCGNHEPAESLFLYNKIHGVHFAVEPEGIDVPGLPLRLEMLPWPRKANLLASIDHAMAPADTDALAVEHLRKILMGMSRVHMLNGTVCAKVMVAHAMVDGSRTSIGQPVRGAELTIGLGDLALARCHAYLLGHIHAPQHWTLGYDDYNAPVVYNGSWHRTSYGETEMKGYVLMRLLQREQGLLDRSTEEYTSLQRWWHTEWERIATPCAPMHLFEAEWMPGVGFTNVLVNSSAPTGNVALLDRSGPEGSAVLLPPIPHDVEGAEIRFRYTVDADERPAAKAAADKAKQAWLAAGAVDVDLDPHTRPQSRARLPEIATASTTEGKLDLFWQARNEVPLAERRARLLEKLAVIESEVGR